MGWTLTGCNFQYHGQLVNVHALGNNAAWICPLCGWPVLFLYRGAGGRQASPAACHGCGTMYYLEPQFGATPEPPRGQPTPPAATLDIV